MSSDVEHEANTKDVVLNDDDAVSMGSLPTPSSTEYARSLDPPMSRGEQYRDYLLRTLDRPFFQILGLIVLFFVILSGAIFFFFLMGWQTLCRPRTDCQPRNDIYNISIQALNICFTYMATVSMPWRCVNFVHIVGISCPHRDQTPGRDLYGWETNEAWFHIPLRRRLGITIILILNCLTQYANQGTRIKYYNYQLQDEAPGNIWTNVFFGISFLCAGIGGAWLAYEVGVLRKAHPGKFGAGPIEMLHSLYNQYVLGHKKNKEGNHDEAQEQQLQLQESDDKAMLENGNAAETAANPDERKFDNGMIDPTRESRRRSILPTQRSSMRMFGM